MSIRDELLNEEIFENLAHARRLLEHWRRDYNQVRPHSAHGGLPPAEARRLAAAPGRNSSMVPPRTRSRRAPTPAINPMDSPHERGTLREQIRFERRGT